MKILIGKSFLKEEVKNKKPCDYFHKVFLLLIKILKSICKKF